MMLFRKCCLLGFWLFSLFLLAGCSCSGGRNRTDVEWLQDMMKQPSFKEQEGGAKGESTLRIPPKNTRARNKEYYPYKGRVQLAEKNLQNPYAGQLTAAVIGRGKRQYEKTCIVCHGPKGDGVGLVSMKMAVRPPSLLTVKVMNYSDGRIYHIIHEGQGLMGSYKKQVFRKKDRWALVNYIRMLQRENLQRKVQP